MTEGQQITPVKRFFLQTLNRMRVMPRRTWLLLLTLFTLALAILIWRGWLHPTHANSATKLQSSSRLDSAQVQTVRVAQVTLGEMPIELNALGTVTPLASVTAKTQVSGTLMKVMFREGQFVQKGDFTRPN